MGTRVIEFMWPPLSIGMGILFLQTIALIFKIATVFLGVCGEKRFD